MPTDEWTCPHCGADLRGPKIPNSDRHYSRRIGIEVRGVYDGVLFWQCPDCGGKQNRWPEDHPRHAVAERYMAMEGRDG